MKNTATRVAVLIFGLLLMGMGFFLFSTPLLNSMVVAYIACILMMLYGISEIAYYFAYRKEHVISGWVLADGIIATILGLLLVFEPGARILATTIIFALWLLFTGVTRIIAAISAKDVGAGGTGWLLATGILGMIIGIGALFNPLYGILLIGHLIPFVFIMQGISALSIFFYTGLHRQQ